MNRIILYFTAILLLFVTACEVDDFPAPDAQFFGAIIDAEGGALVETELINGSTITAYELGYSSEVAQTWVIKNNGEFRNNLVFPNDYRLEFQNGNFFPFTVDKVTIKPGENDRDFSVTPYIRIKDCNIIRDNVANQIVATFKLEAGDPAVKVRTIRLYAFSDMYVGENVKFNTLGTGFSQNFDPSIDIDESSSYTLSIDLAANADLLKAGRNYYFRVGALADISGVGTVRYNFAPYVKITL